jgi:hypothetical protein
MDADDTLSVRFRHFRLSSSSPSSPLPCYSCAFIIFRRKEISRSSEIKTLCVVPDFFVPLLPACCCCRVELSLHVIMCGQTADELMSRIVLRSRWWRKALVVHGEDQETPYASSLPLDQCYSVCRCNMTMRRTRRGNAWKRIGRGQNEVDFRSWAGLS